MNDFYMMANKEDMDGRSGWPTLESGLSIPCACHPKVEELIRVPSLHTMPPLIHTACALLCRSKPGLAGSARRLATGPTEVFSFSEVTALSYGPWCWWWTCWGLVYLNTEMIHCQLGGSTGHAKIDHGETLISGGLGPCCRRLAFQGQ